jgi:hypothetical protein
MVTQKTNGQPRNRQVPPEKKEVDSAGSLAQLPGRYDP